MIELAGFSVRACAVAAVSDDKLLFVRQFRKSLGRHCLELPGGIVDDGETLIKCAEREFREETGFSVDRLSHRANILTSPSKAPEFNALFVGRLGHQFMNDAEFESLFLSPEEVLRGEYEDIVPAFDLAALGIILVQGIIGS